MTDITELAQREKFEAWAEEVGAQPWGYLKKQRNPSGGYSVQIYTYMWTAWKAAGAELVEALEKAQQRIEELREWNAGLAQESFERQQRISELLEGKVGSALLERENHHVEVVGKLTERIADLESRTVKLPPNVDSSNVPFAGHAWNCCLDEVEKCLTAAGIKLETE